jgi:hypothetical protein
LTEPAVGVGPCLRTPDRLGQQNAAADENQTTARPSMTCSARASRPKKPASPYPCPLGQRRANVHRSCSFARVQVLGTPGAPLTRT